MPEFTNWNEKFVANQQFFVLMTLHITSTTPIDTVSRVQLPLILSVYTFHDYTIEDVNMYKIKINKWKLEDYVQHYQLHCNISYEQLKCIT